MSILLIAATLSFTKPEIVTATFASEVDVEKAQIAIAPLPDGTDFAKDSMPKIKANGGRFGNHSVSHPFLMESGVNLMFCEILNRKIFVGKMAAIDLLRCLLIK